MKSSQALLLAGAIVAICFIPSVLSLKCYICNSLNDGKGCGHGADADKALIKDCSTQAPEDGIQGANYTFCRKIVTWIDFDVNNNTATERIVRKCGYLTSKYDNDCYYRGGFGGRQQVCTCNTDECNSGVNFKVNHLLMASAAAVLLFVAGLKH